MAERKNAILILDCVGLVTKVLKEPHGTIDQTQAIWASSAKDASRKAALQVFDLVVVDVPRRERDEVLEAIQKLPAHSRPKRKVVLLEPGDAPCAQVEGLMILRKPFGDGVFQRAVAIALAEKGAGPGTAPKVDVNFLIPFIEGVVHVLGIMAQIRPERDRLFIRTGEQTSGDISAVMMLQGVRHVGSVAIAFKAPCFLAIVNSMLGENHSKLTPEIADAVGEICNQVFGFAKAKLNADGHEIKSNLPLITMKEAHTVQHGAGGICLAVSFRTPAGPFLFEAVVQGA